MEENMISDMIDLLAKCATCGGRFAREAQVLFVKMGMEIPKVALKYHLPDERQYLISAPELLGKIVVSEETQGDHVLYTLENGVKLHMYCDMSGFYYVVLADDNIEA